MYLGAVENLLYFSKHDSIRPKNWHMSRTNWYNCFRKGFMGYRFCKNFVKIGHLALKEQKIAVKMQKGFLMGV